MPLVKAERLLPWAPVLVAALVVASHAGCSSSCDAPSNPQPEDVRTGTTDLEQGVYESVPWKGTYHEFGPQKRYRFYHGLGGPPRVVQAWLSFVEEPLAATDQGNVSEGVGNQAIVQDVTDEYIVIRNDTCADFYLRLVASSPVAPINE